MLDAGPVVGTFLKIPRFEVVDLLALAGFDFIVCDYEHAQMTIGDATDIVRAGVGRGLPVVVRVRSLDRGDIYRLLEAGAAGIQLARGSSDATAGLRTLVSYRAMAALDVASIAPSTSRSASAPWRPELLDGGHRAWASRRTAFLDRRFTTGWPDRPWFVICQTLTSPL